VCNTEHNAVTGANSRCLFGMLNLCILPPASLLGYRTPGPRSTLGTSIAKLSRNHHQHEPRARVHAKPAQSELHLSFLDQQPIFVSTTTITSSSPFSPPPIPLSPPPPQHFKQVLPKSSITSHTSLEQWEYLPRTEISFKYHTQSPSMRKLKRSASSAPSQLLTRNMITISSPNQSSHQNYFRWKFSARS
jgi:hypothetical protein